MSTQPFSSDAGFVTTGNVTANLLIGNGAMITGLPAGYTDANVFSYLGSNSNVVVTTTGNVSGNLIIGNGSQLTNLTGANVVGEVAIANTVSNPVQSNITGLGTLTSLSTGSLNTSGQFTANANAQFNGNVFFAGNVNIAGNITQISGNSAQFYGANATGFGALYAGLLAGYTPLAQEITQFAGSFNGYSQVTLRNISGGDQSTGDFVVTGNDGTDTTNFVNLGFTGSGYNGLLANNSLGTSVGTNDGYLYAQGNGVTGGNLIVGSNQVNGVVRIIANGQSNIGNVVATFSAGGLQVANTVLASQIGNAATFLYGDGSNITNVTVSSVTTIITDATITPAATNTQYNVIALSEPATIAAPSGTPVDGAKLTLRIRDSGLTQPLTWASDYQVIGTVLPTATVSGKTLYVGCIYNDSELTWDVVSVAQQA